jgi:peroxiredoxin
VIGVTLDSPEVSQTSMRAMPIDFSLVTVDSSVFRIWGVLHPERGAPLPATYIDDETGLVRFRHVGRNASDRTTDAELITVLEGMSGS